jgi:hypothetical protein
LIVNLGVRDLNGSNKLEERATEQAYRGRVQSGPAFLFISIHNLLFGLLRMVEDS